MMDGAARIAGRLGLVMVLAWVSAGGAVRAQPASAVVRMTASPTRVDVGEPFRLLIEVKASGAGIDQLVVPDLRSFDVLSRQDSSPLQFRFGFGTGTQTLQASRVHEVVLRAREPGRYPLEPARARVGGREYRSEAVTIEVVEGAGPPPVDMVPDPSGADAPQGMPEYDPEAFLRTVVTPERAYVGQQVTVTVYLYSRRSLRSPPSITQEPIANDFWVHDLLPVSRTLDARPQVVQGQQFRVYVLRRFAAFPLRAGSLTIRAPEVTLETGSVFGFQAPTAVHRVGAPVTVEVLPLPAGSPPGTVVGRYALATRLDRTEVRTGDAATLTAEIEGTGNIRDIELALPPVDGLRVLTPRLEDEPTQEDDLLGGKRTVEWLVLVDHPGTFTLPPLTLHQIDPQTGALSTVTSEPLRLVAVGLPVAGGSGADTANADADVSSAVADDGPRFGPVRTHSALVRHRPPVRDALWFRLILGLPPLLLAAWLLFRLGRRALEARVRGDRAGTALRSARQALRRARSVDGERDPAGFYGEIAHALKTAVEGRLGEPIGGLTYAQLRHELFARGMPDSLVGRLVDELESCDFARFSAAGTSREEIDRCVERAETLVARIARFSPGAPEDA